MDRYTAPVKLRALYMPKLWGGRRIAQDMHRDIPSDDIGEAWDISAIEGAQSIVLSPDGEMALGDYVRDPRFYGAVSYEQFPLLIKVIGATDMLSVQVHPSDDTCMPGEAGKAEAWVILAAEPGAQLVYGLTCSKEDFRRAVEQGRSQDCLNFVDVHAGQVFNIRPGQVHAIGAGITLYEVQQTSDTTYRVYDFDRRDAQGNLRELHVERALAVADDSLLKQAAPGVPIEEPGALRTIFLKNPYFALERADIAGTWQDAWFDSFSLYTVVEGQGQARGRGGSLEVEKGDVFMMPAAAGAMVFDGNASLIKSHVPPEAAYLRWLSERGARVGREDVVERV